MTPLKTVLVVDDFAMNRELAVDMLRLLGLRTMEARDGVDALERVRAQPPDLVVMDLLMPQMDGIEAIRHLRQLDVSRKVPIIASSAGDIENGLAALQAGADVFAPKPLNMHKFLGDVVRLLELPTPALLRDRSADRDPLLAMG